jgi:hypothetical protein
MVFMVMLIFLGCGRKTIKGESPVNELKFYSSYVSVKLEEGYPITSVLYEDIFDGYRPGLSPRQVSEYLNERGRHSKIGQDAYYLEFPIYSGRLRVYEEYNPEEGVKHWVGLVPYDRILDHLIIPQVSGEIDLNNSILERIYIQNYDRTEFLTLNLDNGRVMELSWLKK